MVLCYNRYKNHIRNIVHSNTNKAILQLDKSGRSRVGHVCECALRTMNDEAIKSLPIFINTVSVFFFVFDSCAKTVQNYYAILCILTREVTAARWTHTQADHYGYCGSTFARHNQRTESNNNKNISSQVLGIPFVLLAPTGTSLWSVGWFVWLRIVLLLVYFARVEILNSPEKVKNWK